MALKKHLNDTERFGLTQEEIKLAERYLRKNKTAGAVPESQSMKLYELYMIGYSFNDIHLQHPQYSIPQVILTAALRGWPMDREKMSSSLKDRLQARIVRSVIEQVDFLTMMLSVANTEHIEAMRKYIMDPANNPKPDIRVETIKEYKEVAETLHKLVAGVGGSKKPSPMMDSLNSAPKKAEIEEEEEQSDPAKLIAAQVIDSE